METNYVEGRSDNLPGIDPFMISAFFVDNMKYLSAEIKDVKNVRAARIHYGDQAVGYVQLKREGNICILKGKITPEHKVRSKSYDVTIKVDKANDKIVSSECHDCTASYGGCKHAIAFLYWLLRRSEEPSPTSVACYWKKAALSKVGITIKMMKVSDLKTGEAPVKFSEKQGFLDKVVEKGKEQRYGGNLLNCFIPQTSLKKLSMHCLCLNYFKSQSNADVDNFIEYYKNEMSEEVCKVAVQETMNQYKSPLWYELRYARITGSKIYEASVCGVFNGALFEQIMGAFSLPDTEAMKRGRELEDEVHQVVAQKYK